MQSNNNFITTPKIVPFSIIALFVILFRLELNKSHKKKTLATATTTTTTKEAKEK